MQRKWWEKNSCKKWFEVVGTRLFRTIYKSSPFCKGIDQVWWRL